MSASEKLKALEAPARPYWDEDSKAQEHIIAANRCVDALVDALPQIVAVVEAMEALSRWERFPEVQQFASEPLTALEEALS